MSDIEVLEELNQAMQQKNNNEIINNADFINSKNAVEELLQNRQLNKELCQPTLFEKLDNHLNGGLMPGLYIIGALPSIGKTTLTLQIASNLCKGGSNVLFCNFEMSAEELTAKRISRSTYEICKRENYDTKYAKIENSIIMGRYLNVEDNKYRKIEEDILNEAKEMVSNENGLYIAWKEPPINQISIDDIKNIVVEFINNSNNKKTVLIIDYLQIIKPKSEHMSERANVDFIVSTLKRISSIYKIPVIAISSLNRQNYTNEVNLTSFKESGGIEFGSDVLFGMQFNGQGEKGFDLAKEMNREPRQIEIKILKNRKGGGVYKSIIFNYYPRFNYFEEIFELVN